MTKTEKAVEVIWDRRNGNCGKVDCKHLKNCMFTFKHIEPYFVPTIERKGEEEILYCKTYEVKDGSAN